MAQINERQKPWAITQDELALRFDYAEGRINLVTFNRQLKKLMCEGKIVRSGKVINKF